MPEYDHFDIDIIIYINNAFANLTQLGIGPEKGFSISDMYSKWSDFLSDQDPRLNHVMSYVYAKVRILFNPPSSSVVMEALNKTIAENEWRLTVTADTKRLEECNQ